MSLPSPTFDDLLVQLRAEAEITVATALRYRADGAERIYSSDPDRFPDAYYKRFDEAPAMSRVRAAPTPVLTDGIEALRAEFADWQKIVDGGCNAIVNIPVRTASGEVVGQLNLMGRSGSFPEKTRTQLHTIANAAVGCFLELPQKGSL